MSGHQRGGQCRMPINRRIGVLDKVLADALDWYVNHPLHKPWEGGERGDPYMIEETDKNHRLVEEAASAFLSEMRDAIYNLNHLLHEQLRGEIISDERYPETGFVLEALGLE